jgi:hypothetical protein
MDDKVYGPIYTKQTFMKRYNVEEDTFRKWTRGETDSGARLKVCRISLKYCYIYQIHIDQFFIVHLGGMNNV